LVKGAMEEALEDEALEDEALEDDFAEVSADESLSLPLPFLPFGLLFFFVFFCTFEGAAFGVTAAAAGRFTGFAFLVLPPAGFLVGAGAGATAGTLPVLAALERVVGAILLFCWNKYAK
jgi:hypothetical protein